MNKEAEVVRPAHDHGDGFEGPGQGIDVAAGVDLEHAGTHQPLCAMRQGGAARTILKPAVGASSTGTARTAVLAA